MATNFNNVYQFKITLKGSKPNIWRRIQVPENYSFWDLHVAIQDAMGWFDCHLHMFNIGGTYPRYEIRIGLPEADEYLHSAKVKMKKYFQNEKDKAMYEYDFGDGWEHQLLLEKILPKDPQVDYPLCLAGKMACPPEDCGGIWGYADMLKVLADPKHSEYEDMVDWIGDDFDPLDFDPKEVLFDDPKERLKFLMSF